METIFSLRYSQNGGDAADGPSIADFWRRENADRACPSDCVVVEREVVEEYALINCED